MAVHATGHLRSRLSNPPESLKALLGATPAFPIRENREIGAVVGALLGRYTELIGGSVYEIDPGKKRWPCHLHHANEEWLVVLRRRPTLRTPEGERILLTRHAEPPKYWDGES